MNVTTTRCVLDTHPAGEGSRSTWPRLAVSILVSFLVYLFIYWGQLYTPVLPYRSPAPWARYHWPLIGSVRFYGKRRDMIMSGTHAFPSGIFSFFIGRKHIVNLGGMCGRSTFFESKDFSVSQGFVELLTGLVSSNDARKDYGAGYFVKCVAALSRAEKISRRLPVLASDARDFCNKLLMTPPVKSSSEWRVTDVNDSVYFLLYRLVQRSLGATEIAENEDTMRHTLQVFETFEKSTSLTRIIFPWLPTPNYLARQLAGARLYIAIMGILKKRKSTGERKDDALQYIHDQDPSDDDKVVRFIFSALSSSVTMSGASVTWLVAFLAKTPEWQSKCREEADAALLELRTGTNHPVSTESANDTLATLSLQDWESKFPMLYLCLKETLRMISTGTFFRKNVSGGDIPIGESGSVVPNNSYAAFLPDHVHMDPVLYPDPSEFRPGRYLEPSLSDEPELHSFVGWGSGRHLCAGMRLARLEINIMIVHMLANFEWELSDEHGHRAATTSLIVDRNSLRPQKSPNPVYIRYRSRKV